MYKYPAMTLFLSAPTFTKSMDAKLSKRDHNNEVEFDSDDDEIDDHRLVIIRKHQVVNMDVSCIAMRVKNREWNLSPPYQRGDVWSCQMQQRLIEHILYKIGYVPPIVTCYCNDNMITNVVDGKQRLNAIVQYMDDKYPVRRQKFSGLQPVLQDRFRKSVIPIAQHEGLSLNDELDLYKALQWGVKLTNGEKLHARMDPIMLFVKSAVNDRYKHIFFHRTASQRKRHMNYTIALIAVIMIAENGRVVTRETSQSAWLDGPGSVIDTTNLFSRCSAVFRRLTQIRAMNQHFYDVEMYLAEMVFLAWFMSTKEGLQSDNTVLFNELKRTHILLPKKGISQVMIDQIKSLWGGEEPSINKKRRRMGH